MNQQLLLKTAFLSGLQERWRQLDDRYKSAIRGGIAGGLIGRYAGKIFSDELNRPKNMIIGGLAGALTGSGVGLSIGNITKSYKSKLEEMRQRLKVESFSNLEIQQLKELLIRELQIVKGFDKEDLEDLAVYDLLDLLLGRKVK